MQSERISVIIPVYNAEKYLKTCLDSVTGQTHRNLEIILVDDGSPDNCGAVCDEYAAKDDRIIVIHQTNGGAAAARNAGLDAAVGTWIGFVDPDDYIELDMYEYLLTNALAYHADLSVCGMGTLVDGEPADSWLTHYDEAKVLDRERAIEAYLGRDMHDGCVNKLYRRELWDGLRFPRCKIAEDLLTMWEIFQRANVTVRLSGDKYVYCRHSGSATTTKDAQTCLEDFHAVKKRCDEVMARWPQFETLAASRCVESAIGLWCGYCGFSPEERKFVHPHLQDISEFCRPYIHAALAHTDMGPTGRLCLRLVAWPDRWALGLACLVNWVYQRKHRWSL